MRKIFLLFVLFFLFGCSRDSVVNDVVKNIVRSEITCTTDDSKFNLILENGQIVKYIDSIDGELGQEIVDILNSEHLIGVSDNDKALNIMDSALKDLNGHCEVVSLN